ncbi:MAG: DUF2064 domain-containing protein, partial [Nitrososphaeraceae archaeon]|nr:DUF2064 domain-containing protein [Nitrososphaeraceae archaeon]
MSEENLLLIFVKNPELGKCKTRLAATIGDIKALAFYKNMLLHTKDIVDKVDAQKTVYYSSYIDHNDLWPNSSEFNKAKQAKGDLGSKMKAAFEEGFNSGYKRICIIGSDCFGISPM